MHPDLAALLSSSSYCVALTGAGVSTLSGIPDFRGQQGLYRDPKYLQAFDIDLFRRDPSVYYGAFREILYGERDYQPNAVHRALAALEAEGRLRAVITQNIDGLHQRAGSATVREVHGSAAWHRCQRCGTAYSLDEVRGQIHQGIAVPLCSCKGVLKPEITFFGEALPPAFDAAFGDAQRADLMLVLGTSLTVQPAASLPSIVLQNGGRVAIVNAQPTPLDHRAALRLWSLEDAFGLDAR